MAEKDKQPEDIEEDFIFTETHDKAIKWLFTSLVTWFANDKQLFFDLYYNREGAIKTFTGMLLNAKDELELKNILITGRSGLGKTSFLYRIIGDEAICKEIGIKPIFVDYSDGAKLHWTSCLYRFVNLAEKAFKEIGHPINNLMDNYQEIHIEANITMIREHLAYLKGQDAPHIVIFLDDFDYANDVWFKILAYFIPFAAKSPASIVLSARPPLKAAIEGYDSRYSLNFTRDVNLFDLKPLGVENVIASRLAPLLEKRKSEGIVASIINKFKPSVVEQLRRKLGITDADDLSEFQYPLTQRHNNFMMDITNGDLREIFDIAYDSICYVLKKSSTLETRVEFGHTRFIIGREATLELFYDNDKAKYKIIDLHQRKSKKAKNSLWYNVLEAIMVFKIIDEINFYPALKTFGHTNKAVVDKAIKALSTKTNRLIEPVKISFPGSSLENTFDDEYELTEKGKYYLEIAKWPEYRKRFGDFGKSLKEEYKS